jgi:tripartite-type tricarboxylate transporter receptor subunit TctC
VLYRTVRDIVMKLHGETLRALAAPDIRNRMQPEGAEFIGNTPEQFAAFLREEYQRWGELIKVSGVSVE